MKEFACRASAVLGFLVIIICAAGSLAAQTVPLTNWPVPGRPSRVASNAELSALTPFVAVTPCRVVDTRNVNGPFGGPSFAAGSSRRFVIPSSACGLPVAEAYSVNVTVVNYDVASAGFVTAWPAGYSRPFVSTVNFGTGPAVANAAIIAAGTFDDYLAPPPRERYGVIEIYTSGATHLIVDINGYFAALSVGPDLPLRIFGSFRAAVIEGVNSSYWPGASGVTGSVTNAYANISGVYGSATGSAANYGVSGQQWAGNYDSAGVLGYSKARSNTTSSWERAGVRGESSTGGELGVGVLGISSFIGVSGALINLSGGQVAAGVLGYNGYGVYSFGNTGASGTKSFVEPHPTDATKVIRYVSLEGPEAGTYFRGRGRIVDGRAVIDVPESFRMVSEEEGLTVHLTAMTDGAGVLKVGAATLDGIEVVSEGDGGFFYIVHGVRKGYGDFEAIAEGTEYVPRNPAERLPLHLNDSQKQRLIENGTYNSDGTVNLSTAVKLGWAKAWAENAVATRAESEAAPRRDN